VPVDFHGPPGSLDLGVFIQCVFFNSMEIREGSIADDLFTCS
jgi:hypothetical protein